MSFVTTWAVPGTEQLVHLKQQPLEVFSRYIQEGSDATEAGGILLGHVRGQHLEIIEATEPSFWDRRFRFLFERMPYFHHRLAMKRWRESNGLVRYVGEWHTHPQDHPTPSSIDLKEWQILAADRVDGRELLAVIVGCRDLHVAYMSNTGKRRVLEHAELEH
ncbi:MULTISPECIES: Mov34/MPN/PAD-1 family protein [Pseudomonas syringae group]|uniref:Mov34/MPN/PAD-1 family protein n=1 Tax=Pseudomonas syringae group TaxID=136849 RepID=UPI000EFFEEDF|nr:Mov34/MPN/PAD-1 family protein [Pseudomonas syringae group genomosp. 3]